MRKTALVMLLLLLPVGTLLSDAPEVKEGLSVILSELDLSAWDRWFIENDPSVAFIPSEFMATAVLQGRVEADSQDLMERIASFVKADAAQMMRKAAIILGFGILTSLASALQRERDAVLPGGVVRLLGGCLVLGLCAPVLRDASLLLDRIRDGAEQVMPLLLGFFALFDCSQSSALLHPSITLLCDGMIRSVTDIVFPLALIGGVLHALDLSGDGRLEAVGITCQRAGQWIVAAESSLYLGVTAVRGTVAVRSDTLLLRTAKLAAGSLPFVGGLASDSIDTLFQSVTLVRATLGITGILLLVLALLRPVLRLLLERMLLKACAAIVLPIGLKEYARLLDRMGNMIGLVSAAVVVTLLMAAVTIGLLTGVWQTV